MMSLIEEAKSVHERVLFDLVTYVASGFLITMWSFGSFEFLNC